MPRPVEFVARQVGVAAAALHRGEEALFARVAARLDPQASARLRALVADDGGDADVAAGAAGVVVERDPVGRGPRGCG